MSVLDRLDREVIEREKLAEFAQENRMPAWFRTINNPMFDLVTLPLIFTGGGLALQGGKALGKQSFKKAMQDASLKSVGKGVASRLPKEVALGAGGLAGYEGASLLTDNPLLQAIGGLGGAGLVAGGMRGLPSSNMKFAFKGNGLDGKPSSIVELEDALEEVTSGVKYELLTPDEKVKVASDLISEYAKIDPEGVSEVLARGTGFSLDNLRGVLSGANTDELGRYTVINDYLASKLPNNTTPLRVRNTLRDQSTILDENIRLANDSIMDRFSIVGGGASKEVVGEGVQQYLLDAMTSVKPEVSAIMAPKYREAFDGINVTDGMVKQYDEILDNRVKNFVNENKNLVGDPEIEALSKGIQHLKEGVRKGELNELNLSTIWDSAFTKYIRQLGKGNMDNVASVLDSIKKDTKNFIKEYVPNITELDDNYFEEILKRTEGRFGNFVSSMIKTSGKNPVYGEVNNFITDPVALMDRIFTHKNPDQIRKMANTLSDDLREQVFNTLIDNISTSTLSQNLIKKLDRAKLFLNEDNVFDREKILNINALQEDIANSLNNMEATGTLTDKKRDMNLIALAGEDVGNVLRNLPIGIGDLASALGDSNTVQGIIKNIKPRTTEGTNIKTFGIQNPKLFTDIITNPNLPESAKQNVIKNTNLPSSEKVGLLKFVKKLSLDEKKKEVLGVGADALPYGALNTVRAFGNEETN